MLGQLAHYNQTSGDNLHIVFMIPIAGAQMRVLLSSRYVSSAFIDGPVSPIPHQPRNSHLESLNRAVHRHAIEVIAKKVQYEVQIPHA